MEEIQSRSEKKEKKEKRKKLFKIHNLPPGEQGAFAEAFQMLTRPYFTVTASSHLHNHCTHSDE